MNTPLRLLAVTTIVVIGCAILGCGPGSSPETEPVPPSPQTPIPGIAPHVQVVETGPLPIDRIYRSMAGPSEWVDVDLSKIGWVTAYKTEVVDAQSGEPLGDEFFCHSQLQQLNSTRLMVTATGASTIRFPRGFAMPVHQLIGDLPKDQQQLKFLGMVLNNYDTEMNTLAKVRAEIEYYTPSQAGRRLKKLYKTVLTMAVEDIREYSPPADQPANEDVTTHCALVGEGVYHWFVPPGPQLTRKRYRDFLPVNGTVHQAVVHLHNHGIYFRLTDVTANKVLWQTDVVYEPDRVQIAEIPMYSSETGFRVYADHEYEIEAFYNNTTDHDVDAMAQIDLYYRPDGDVNIHYPHSPT